MRYLAVTMERGPAWDASRDIREQDGWEQHAEVMDRWVDEGYVVLGGPIGDGKQVLVVVDAEDESEVHRRFAADPWKDMELLLVGAVEPWTIWLDGRAGSAQANDG